MRCKICLPVCWNVSVVAFLAFVVTSLLFNPDCYKLDNKNHHKRKGDGVRRGCIRRCILENGSIKDKESPAANLLPVSKKAAGLFINL